MTAISVVFGLPHVMPPAGITWPVQVPRSAIASPSTASIRASIESPIDHQSVGRQVEVRGRADAVPSGYILRVLDHYRDRWYCGGSADVPPGGGEWRAWITVGADSDTDKHTLEVVLLNKKDNKKCLDWISTGPEHSWVPLGKEDFSSPPLAIASVVVVRTGQA